MLSAPWHPSRCAVQAIRFGLGSMATVVRDTIMVLRSAMKTTSFGRSSTPTSRGLVGLALASLTLLALLAQSGSAQIRQAELQRSFPDLAAALARNDLNGLRTQMEALDPEGRQRVLTALHAMRVSPSSLQSGRDGTSGLGGGSNPGGAGGASLANFSELMQLIETTISPDEWLNAGGTATMNPFTQGVRIDPAGVIQRIENAPNEGPPKLRDPNVDRKTLSTPSIGLDALGAWQQPTPLRWISLHQLDRDLKHQLDAGQSASIAAELLGGLCRIDFVAWDEPTGEWLIGGPAGDIAANRQSVLLHRSLRLPPILLEDLLTVSAHVLQQRGDLGCSIDPVPERLVDAYAMANQPSSTRMLRRDPEGWADAWKAKLGKQKATIIGIPDDSPTGLALIVADAHMKRLAFGLEPSIDGLNNYWIESDTAGGKQAQSMVRWWFSMAKHGIPFDPDRHLYRFEKSNVEVLSETQMMNQQGQRLVANAPDAAADAYARNFTRRFDDLQRVYPEYGRLRHVFDLSVALEIIRSQIQAGHGEPFQVLGTSQAVPHLDVAPKEIDSIVATRRRSDGSISAIVSGGVSIDLRSTSQRLRQHRELAKEVHWHASPGESMDEAALETSFWR